MDQDPPIIPHVDYQDTYLKIKETVKKPLGLIGVVLVLAAITGAGYYIYQNYLKKPVAVTTSNAFSTNTYVNELASNAIAKVGEETLYRADLDNYLAVYNPAVASQNVKNKESMDQAIEKLIDESLILQKAAEDNLIKLDSNTFNSANKNLQNRALLVQEAKKKLADKYVGKISGEAVNMWFNNATAYPSPSIGVEAAKTQVKQKMDTFAADINSGKLTIYDAAVRVRNDSAQNSIDPSYKGNAYTQFKDKSFSQSVFKDDAINDTIWKLNLNQTTPVLTVKDYKADNSSFEAYFTIIKVTSKTEGTFADFDKLLSDLRSKYEITRY